MPSSISALEEFVRTRRVRYAELVPCTTAFIDTRTPGSAQKENFTIIGPGVSESPDQHVHIPEPHGFNIGGARQPPNCTNSQHSHETAEVFIVHSGRWAFYLGEQQQDGQIELGPGDTISIPVHVFRGFENIGDDVGFLFAVLGGDDPGHVLWAPYVFEQAEQYGLVLLEDGSLYDRNTDGPLPAGKRPQAPTTAEDVARLRRMSAEDIARCVVRNGDSKAVTVPGTGLNEAPLIGAASADEALPAGAMDWPHGFCVRHVALAAGRSGDWHRRAEPEVLLMQRGEITVDVAAGSLTLRRGDTLTVPVGAARRFSNPLKTGAEWIVVRGGDQPSAAMPTDAAPVKT